MIDRSYLPFQSAREYQDTKMQKWMGFFLSEHASALSDDTNKVTYMSDLSLEKKLLLLSQVYAGQLRTRIQVIEKNKRVSYTGTIPSLTKDFILIKTTTGHINLKLKDIISIELVEEVLYESETASVFRNRLSDTEHKDSRRQAICLKARREQGNPSA